MKKSSILSSILMVGAALLLTTSGVARADESAAPAADAEAAAAAKAASDGTGGPDCTKVFQAKAVADKGMSPKHLAEKLGLPVEKVQECLLMLRRGGAPAPE